MRKYKITTTSRKHMESLISDYLKDGYMLLIQTSTTTAVLINEDYTEEIRIDLI